jgi:hypothetical protein
MAISVLISSNKEISSEPPKKGVRKTHLSKETPLLDLVFACFSI